MLYYPTRFSFSDGRTKMAHIRLAIEWISRKLKRNAMFANDLFNKNIQRSINT